ncbi:MAG: integrase core domain-containing protein [Ktedonobacteraceae bacterium]
MAAVNVLVLVLGLLLLPGSVWILTHRQQRLRYGRRRAVSALDHCYLAPKPAWIRQEIIRLKAQGRELGCRPIALIFNRRHAGEGITVGKTFVSTVIRQHRYEIQMARRALHRRPLRPGPRNRVWGLDLTGKTDQRGKLHAILGILDHGTRANLMLIALPNKSTATLLRAIAACVERFGRPRTLRTDNEAMFRSWLFGLSLWLVGIRYQRIEPHCPWQNGRIERFFGSLKGKLDRWTVENCEELQASLRIFRLWTGRDVYRCRPRKTLWFEAWDGLLMGEYVPP